jgi:hypothetical protein
MEVSFEAPSLPGRDLKVRAGGILGRPRLLVDGALARQRGGCYRLAAADGRTVEIRLVRRGDDPFPEVLLDGAKLPDLVPPFQWHHEIWLWLPFPLLCWLGATGVFMGAIAVTVNATLFRWSRSVVSAYVATAVSSLMFVVIGIVVTRGPNELIAAWMTWIVLYGV